MRQLTAACPICMESLFHARDDLDELIPPVTPDCGHVFHEPCVTSWFNEQAQQYMHRMRNQNLRAESPSIEDAPAECPSCRAECYADPDTGKPILHRLYINFDDTLHSSTMPSSSQGPSSPWARRLTLDVAGMNIARRAKGLGHEIEGLNPQSSEGDVESAMRRIDNLRNDALSDKTSAALEKYIYSLTEAIEKLRGELLTHPLVPVLQRQIDELKETEAAQVAEMRRMDRSVQVAVKKAVDAEKIRSTKALRTVKSQRNAMQRELDKEKANRTNFQRAMRDKEERLERMEAKINSELHKEQQKIEELEGQLKERTYQLKQYQAKAESTKRLKSAIDQLKADNETLRAQVIELEGHASQRAPPATESSVGTELGGARHRVLGLRSAYSITSGRWSKKRPSPDPDDTFLDMSLNNDEPVPVRSRTARTFTFDMDDGLLSDRDAGRRRVASKDKTLSHRSASPRTSGSIKGKDDEHAAGANNQNDHGVLVAASSPPDTPLQGSPPKRPRTNPFRVVPGNAATTPVASPTKNRSAVRVVPADLSVEYIDLTGSSPYGARVSSRPLTPEPQPYAPRGGLSDVVDEFAEDFSPTRTDRPGRSTAEMLGIADQRGRPKKGLATGTKVKKRLA